VLGAKEIEMALPKAVQDQIDRADQMVASINAVPGEETQQQVNDPVMQVAPEPVVQTIPTPDWEAKFRTLQGKYNAEVPRFAEQVRKLTESVQSLVEENTKLREDTSRVQVKNETHITDSERETFGSDLIDLQERIAHSVADPLLKKIEQLEQANRALESKVGTVDERVAVSASDRFYETLTARVPDWQDLNDDAGFIAWLDSVDPVYGMPRRVGMDNAAQGLDAERAAIVFNAYRATMAPAQRTPAQQLASQVAPTRSRNTPVPVTGNNGKFWTERDIQAFYADLRRGHIDDAEASRIEQEIQLAVSEGRVR
jgi:hypothetical protein